jgi:hypothetical protein
MHIVKRTGDRCVRRHPAAIRPNVKCLKRRRGTPKISNLWPDVALSISLPLSDERNKNFVEFFQKYKEKTCVVQMSERRAQAAHRERALPSRPVFLPSIWQLHASTIIPFFSHRLYLFSYISQHTYRHSQTHRIPRTCTRRKCGGGLENIFFILIYRSIHHFKVSFDLIWRFNQRWCKVRFSNNSPAPCHPYLWTRS